MHSVLELCLSSFGFQVSFYLGFYGILTIEDSVGIGRLKHTFYLLNISISISIKYVSVVTVLIYGFVVIQLVSKKYIYQLFQRSNEQSINKYNKESQLKPK